MAKIIIYIYIYIYLTARIYFRKHSCFLTRQLPARGVPIAYFDLTYIIYALIWVVTVM